MAFWIVASVATDLVERLRPAGGVRSGVAAPRAPDPARDGRHDDRAPRHRRLHPRRDAGAAPARSSATCGWRPATRRRSATSSSPSAACATCTGRTTVPRRARSRSRDERPAGSPTLQPEKRFYPAAQRPMTEAAIDVGLTRDLYVSLGEPVDGGAWIVRVYVKPFVDWIWGGCLLMALGGLLAATDRRYRATRARRAEQRRRRGRSAGMKRLWFLVPLAAFLALAGRPRGRPEARSARSAVAADRQAGAEVRAAAARRRRRGRSASTTCAARSGCSTSGPRGASPAARSIRCCSTSRRSSAVPLYGLNYKDKRADASAWLARFGNPYDASLFDDDGRVGIDFGVYGVPETFVIDAQRRHPPEAHRPADARGAGEQDRAAAEEARCAERAADAGSTRRRC